MNDQPKQDTNQEVVEPTVVEEAVLEEKVVEEVLVEKTASEEKPKQVATSSNKTIKDYLSKDLFEGIKVISGNEDQVEIEKLADDVLEEYTGTFNDISENQIISAKRTNGKFMKLSGRTN